jgi:hypothetical protein
MAADAVFDAAALARLSAAAEAANVLLDAAEANTLRLVGVEGAEGLVDALVGNPVPTAPISGPSCPVVNFNPYQGPVSEPIIAVDPFGNAIPVNTGEYLSSSPNGDFQQVRDPNGDFTGVRLDRGGHPGQSDPAAQIPHSHVPGITQPDGNPHLPIYSGKP